MQLYHAGRETTKDILGEDVVAPSAIKDPTMPDVPRELTIEEIKDLVEKFGDGAVRSKISGFDAVEVHCAHGYLINTFLSPFSNKRTDEYGGTLWNRTRFVREIIKNIKSKVGEDYPIICRVSSDELVSGGLTIEDTKAIVKILEDEGVNAIHASFGIFKSGDKISGTSYVRHANMTDFSVQLKEVLNIPVIGVGRINDPFLAESIVLSNKADMIAMGRGSLADAYFPKKAREGKYEDIITCIACRQGCSKRLFLNKPITCVLNPLTGNEGTLKITEAENKKKVLIAGGGIAGMEAAIVASKRGHDVTLYEKSDKLGGQWLLAGIAPNKEEANSFTVWQKHQLKENGVQVILEQELTKDIVLNEKPDAVIIATGGIEKTPDNFKNENYEYLSKEILSGKEPGQKVAVIGNRVMSAETANHLAAQNHDVTLIIEKNELPIDYEVAPRDYLLQDLELNNAKIITNSKVKSFNNNNLIVICNGKEVHLGKFDSIVYALGYESNNSLIEELKGIVEETIVIGDCKNVRNSYFAIKEGYEAGHIL